MGLAPDSLPQALLWSANLALPAVLMIALHGAPWRSLETAGQQHAFFGAALGVVLLWQLRADIVPGPELHLLGLTAPALVFGWRLTLLIGLLAAAVTMVAGGEPWPLLGIEALVSAAVPVAVTVAFATLVRRLTPPNIFIRCWLMAFIGAMLAAAGTHALRVLLVLWLGPEPAGTADYPMILPLLVFPEGFINGSIVTAVLVYRPQWMVTLRDDPPPHA